MSTWHEIDNNDIEINCDDKSVDILVSNDSWGNVYATLTFEQVKEIARDIIADEAEIK